MAERRPRSDGRRGLPGGFLLFLFAMILVFLAVQSLSGDQKGKVSFGYQLDHLVNLDLLVPQHNRKVAQNDNLVAFSGKFREQLTEEGKQRYHYLELLSQQNKLREQKEDLLEVLAYQKKNVLYSAQWFFQITGIPIPAGGFVVVSPSYNTFDYDGSIVLAEGKQEQDINLVSMKREYEQITANPSSQNISLFDNHLSTLLGFFQSSNLGITNQSILDELKELDQKRSEVIQQGWEAKRVIYRDILNQLEAIKDHIFQERDPARLFSLKAVQAYTKNLSLLGKINKELDTQLPRLEKARAQVANTMWYFNDKELSSRALEKENPEIFNNWFLQAKDEWDRFDANKATAFKAPDQKRNLVLENIFRSEEPSPNYVNYIFTFLPVILVILVLYFLFARQMKGVGSSALNFGKSPARLLTKETNKVTFKDVAGAEESKEELEEIVDFLKDPRKFTSLGARIPKGVLLIGPPGTGKTLIAKAVAGEADRPFFSISGSDFVEMFVGVGASRIRDLFDQAKRNAPCIIFMDEIDAVGRHRGAGIGGGHDEREQTLNQLLVEMDGFDTKEGVILMAATNRPDILDRALLRPGRFDRRVVLDLPDIKGRYEILKVHARRIKIDPSVDLTDIARSTPGASGADLENILNEAALLAARKGRSAVTTTETREACDKVRFGKERRSLDMDEKEKRMIAYHEAGHAMVGLKVEFADPVDKVTIIPRGFALGATHFMPKKNRLNYWKKEVIDQLAILMGGRAAEEIFLKDLSSGAQHDFAGATKLARSMVCEWGMTDELGTISYDEHSDSNPYLGLQGYHEKLYSEKTAQQIDEVVKNLVETAHQRAKEIVANNKESIQLMADMLVEFETLDVQDIKEIEEGTWDMEKKKERLKKADELQKKMMPPPPPPIKEKKTKPEIFPNPEQQPE